MKNYTEDQAVSILHRNKIICQTKEKRIVTSRHTTGIKLWGVIDYLSKKHNYTVSVTI